MNLLLIISVMFSYFFGIMIILIGICLAYCFTIIFYHLFRKKPIESKFLDFFEEEKRK